MTLVLINLTNHMKVQAEGFPNQRLFRLPESCRRMFEMEALYGDLYATDLGHYPRSPGHTVERPEGSESHLLMICLEGSGWLRRGNAPGLTVERHQGVLIPAGMPHAYGSHGEAGWNLYWIHFTGERSAAVVRGMQELEEGGRLHVPESDEIIREFEEAWSAVTGAHSASDWMCAHARTVLFLGTVWRSCRAGGEKARVAEARVRMSMDWMRVHAEEPLTLSQIAKQAGLSVPHYCALFKKHTASTPLRYLRAVRLQKACNLLDQDDTPVQTVAEACGFTNPFHFSRSFKEHIGLSPRAYRKSVKG